MTRAGDAPRKPSRRSGRREPRRSLGRGRGRDRRGRRRGRGLCRLVRLVCPIRGRGPEDGVYQRFVVSTSLAVDACQRLAAARDGRHIVRVQVAQDRDATAAPKLGGRNQQVVRARRRHRKKTRIRVAHRVVLVDAANPPLRSALSDAHAPGLGGRIEQRPARVQQLRIRIDASDGLESRRFHCPPVRSRGRRVRRPVCRTRVCGTLSPPSPRPDAGQCARRRTGQQVHNRLVHQEGIALARHAKAVNVEVAAAQDKRHAELGRPLPRQRVDEGVRHLGITTASACRAPPSAAW